MGDECRTPRCNTIVSADSGFRYCKEHTRLHNPSKKTAQEIRIEQLKEIATELLANETELLLQDAGSYDAADAMVIRAEVEVRRLKIAKMIEGES